MKNSWKLAAAAFSTAALLGGLHGAAQADTFTLNDATTQTKVVNVDGSNYNVGRFLATINGTAINVFCVDVNQTISVPTTFNADIIDGISTPAGPRSGAYYNGGLASALTATDYKPAPYVSGSNLTLQARANEAAYLADTYLNTPLSVSFTTTNLAAIQLSIWDIIQDGTLAVNDGTSLSNGTLTADATYQTLVSGYETAASSFAGIPSATAVWIQAPRGTSDSDHVQEFVFEDGSRGPQGNPVPEPGPLAMLVSLGAAVGGFMLKRLRTRQTA